jgi:hypothetical protein
MSEQQGTGAPNQAPVQAPDLKTELATSTPDPKLDLYAKKERQLRQMQKQLQEEKAALQKRAAEYETGYIPKSRLKDDLWGVLGEQGLSLEQMTEQLLNQPNMNDPATRALMSKIKALEDKQMHAEKQAAEAQQVQYDNAVKQISNEVKQLVDSSSDFETIKELGLVDNVVELIKETYETEGYILDIDAACKQVEEESIAELMKAVKLKKLQERLNPKPVEPVVEAPKQQTQQALKTLTNNVTQTTTKKSSEKERVARAIAAFKGQLT